MSTTGPDTGAPRTSFHAWRDADGVVQCVCPCLSPELVSIVLLALPTLVLLLSMHKDVDQQAVHAQS